MTHDCNISLTCQVITQCSIRHLYQDKSADRRQKDAWIATARTFERRRCDHHELEEPLSTEECLSQVVDPKGSGTNKNRYAVASQSQQVRSNMREIPGVPLVYVKKSVMILEPMASKTADFRASLEKSKLRAGIRPRQAGVAGQETVKRKRDDEEETAEVMPAPVKKRVKTGVKGPNPLSVKRAKTAKSTHSSTEKSQNNTNPASEATVAPDNTKVTDETMAKKKRKRKHKTANGPEPSQQEE